MNNDCVPESIPCPGCGGTFDEHKMVDLSPNHDHKFEFPCPYAPDKKNLHEQLAGYYRNMME